MFVYLSLWCCGLDVDLIVSVPEFIYLLFLNSFSLSVVTILSDDEVEEHTIDM